MTKNETPRFTMTDTDRTAVREAVAEYSNTVDAVDSAAWRVADIVSDIVPEGKVRKADVGDVWKSARVGKLQGRNLTVETLADYVRAARKFPHATRGGICEQRAPVQGRSGRRPHR